MATFASVKPLPFYLDATIDTITRYKARAVQILGTMGHTKIILCDQEAGWLYPPWTLHVKKTTFPIEETCTTPCNQARQPLRTLRHLSACLVTLYCATTQFPALEGTVVSVITGPPLHVVNPALPCKAKHNNQTHQEAKWMWITLNWYSV